MTTKSMTWKSYTNVRYKGEGIKKGRVSACVTQLKTFFKNGKRKINLDASSFEFKKTFQIWAMLRCQAFDDRILEQKGFLQIL